MRFIVNLFITALVATGLSYILSGVHFETFGSALGFAIVLAILNMTVKPILKLIGLPLTVITLGIFSLVINAIVVLIADYFIKGMEVDGFWWAFLFSISLSLVTSVVEGAFGDE